MPYEELCALDYTLHVQQVTLFVLYLNFGRLREGTRKHFHGRGKSKNFLSVKCGNPVIHMKPYTNIYYRTSRSAIHRIGSILRYALRQKFTRRSNLFIHVQLTKIVLRCQKWSQDFILRYILRWNLVITFVSWVFYNELAHCRKTIVSVKNVLGIGS